MSEPRPREGPFAFGDRTATTASPTGAPDAALQIGTTVDGRYCVVSELGRGGMGIVYLARDTWLDRHVALKMVAPTWANDSDMTARFVREAKALASIRSNYVVQVYAFGVHEGSYFFVMEYVRGRTVKELVAAHRKHGHTISPRRTLTIVNRITRGLGAVHAAGILHRDVKPSNIVIEEDTGRPVLVDFGLAVPENDPTVFLSLGTPHYMAPEQVGALTSSNLATVRTDIYALGVTAFEMLTGELPFLATDMARLRRALARKVAPLLSSKRAELAPLDASIALALAKEPALRYPTCAEFEKTLTDAGASWLQGAPVSVLPPPSVGVAGRLVVAALPDARPWDSTPPTPLPSDLVPPKPNDEEETPPTLDGATKVVKEVSAPPTLRGRVVHVLVVDDSNLFRRFAVRAAQIALFRIKKSPAVSVRGAASGHEALELADVQAPDLVILDFDMPGLDGLGTLERLRALPGGHSARVVVLSGRVRESDKSRFAALGVNRFVSKPIELRHLIDAIERSARHFEEAPRAQA